MRLGIIGCGLIGDKRPAAAHGHQIVICADRFGARRKLGRQGGCRRDDRWQAAVDADVDAVMVATAHDNQAAIAQAAIDAGNHVLVEKPAARSAAELAPVADAAAKTRRVARVGFNHRFHPAFAKARTWRRPVNSGRCCLCAAATGMAAGPATKRNGAATRRFPAAAN